MGQYSLDRESVFFNYGVHWGDVLPGSGCDCQEGNGAMGQCNGLGCLDLHSFLLFPKNNDSTLWEFVSGDYTSRSHEISARHQIKDVVHGNQQV